MSLFNEAEATTNLATSETYLTEVKSHYRKRTRLTTDKLPEAGRICTDCGGKLHTMGREIREELRLFLPRL